MNPTSWLQIGPVILSPADNERIGNWDTEYLEDGLYALQLVVIRDQQQVEKTSLVLSVDNTSPVIKLRSDLDGKRLFYETGKELLFELEFANENEIQRVDFSIDSENQFSRDLPPFVYPWTMSVGEFELRITAVDHANNQSLIRITFEVVED
jgi:hypothetical protein